MAATELDSFIWKFNQLWKAGLTAHLDLDTHAGSAWVGLRVQLGHVPPGPLYQQVHQHQYFRTVGQSRQRRRARRLAERENSSTAAAAAEKGSEVEREETAEQDEVRNVTENVITSVIDKDAGENIQHDSEKLDDEKAEEESFKCPICDFESTFEVGLKVHMGRMHRNIKQLDGNCELEDDDKYKNTEEYWKRGTGLGIAYFSFAEAMHLIERTDISEDIKKKEKEKLLEVRKAALGASFSNFPPWNK